jgi:hypothetical protein
MAGSSFNFGEVYYKVIITIRPDLPRLKRNVTEEGTGWIWLQLVFDMWGNDGHHPRK